MGYARMANEIGDTLREMAAHRGLRLVKSRRRKPGTGDYGMFGLTDRSGKPLLGIGDKGLTASPQDVEAYLRKSTTDTWKTSAELTPAHQAPAKKNRESDLQQEDAEPAIRPRGKRSVARGGRGKGRAIRPSATAQTLPKEEPVPNSVREKQRFDGIAEGSKRRAKPKAPEPEPDLVIRPARSADAAALAPLLSQLVRTEIDELAVARNLDAVRKAKGAMAIAEYGDLVGFCSWAVIPTVQHGAIGRITLLLVDEDHRRRGIATALIEAATTALRKAGCARIEAMSDIEIANAHGFFRTLKFEQTSYRFARDIDGPD